MCAVAHLAGDGDGACVCMCVFQAQLIFIEMALNIFLLLCWQIRPLLFPIL